MKYKIFFTDSLEVLKNEELIGEANSFEEIRLILKSKLQRVTPYWRYLLAENATFIDYGSWSRFAAIVPAVTMREITGED